MRNYPQPDITESAANEFFRKEKVSIGFDATISWYLMQSYTAFLNSEPKICHIGGGELEAVGNRHTQNGVLATMEIAVKQTGTKQGFSPTLGWSYYRALMSKETRSGCSLRRKALKKENAKSIVIFKNNHFLLSGYTPNTSYSRCRDQ